MVTAGRPFTVNRIVAVDAAHPMQRLCAAVLALALHDALAGSAEQRATARAFLAGDARAWCDALAHAEADGGDIWQRLVAAAGVEAEAA